MSGLKLWVRRRDGANTELSARRRETVTHKALLFVPWRWVRCAIFTPMKLSEGFWKGWQKWIAARGYVVYECVRES